jgi:hypothetical protein
MEMVPVQSSNVAAIGFEAGLMRVQFLDSATYEYLATAEEHGALMLAPSKGAHIAQHFRKRGTRVDAPQSKPERVWSRNMQTHEPDECCGPALNAALLAGLLDEATEWTHEVCGVEWRAQITGPVKHWQPHCPISILP